MHPYARCSGPVIYPSLNLFTKPFDDLTPQHPPQPPRGPPVAVAEDFHEGGDQERPDDGAIQKDGEGNPKAQGLDDYDVAEGERARYQHQHEGGAGYDPSGFFEAEGHALGVVSGLVVDLPDAGEEEHLIVHREAEEDGEEEDRECGLQESG